MAIFPKDVKEEESISGRRIKDLSSSPRRLTTTKKKDPPMPWTKKDRYLVLIILLTTVVTSGILALSAREWKLPGLPRLKVPSFSIFKDETILLEGGGSKAISKMNETQDEVISRFKSATEGLSGVYGLYVVDLTSGYSFGINENEKFTAASLIKLPAIAALYNLSEEGGINLDDKYTLKDSDKLLGSGSLYAKPAGYEITWRNLVSLMGKQSDNTAFNIVRIKLGDSAVDNEAKKIGMTVTTIGDNETSPKDVGVFFEELWKGNVVNKKDKDEILSFMTDTIYEQWLTPGVPEGVKVSHKYGREVHVVNDAGIVMTDNPYVVVILTKGVVEREADEVFPQLSQIIYNELNGE